MNLVECGPQIGLLLSLFTLKFDLKAQIIFGICTTHRIFVTDQVFFKKIEQRLAQADHPFDSRVFNGIMDASNLACFQRR